MQVSIHGAAGGEVTGSAYLVETDQAQVLVDCGMFQGGRHTESLNLLPRAFDLQHLDAVAITHAHLDHTGRLPMLAKAGYRGPIHATPATIEISDLILRDAASLQAADVERDNRRRARQGDPPREPLYLAADVAALQPLFQPLAYNQPTPIAPGISLRAVEAGHMFGSVSFELTVEEQGRTAVLVFSGDLGPRGAPLHRDPVPFKQADVVFMESTYGDRDHRSLSETVAEAYAVLKQAVAKGSKILVPSFAIGRTQVILYLLAGAFQRGDLPKFPIYVDSPMAIEATRIYGAHVELFDEEAQALQKAGLLRANLDTVHFCRTSDESRALNHVAGPCLIMAGSGMCNGGRILHHLRHNLDNPNTTVLVVGFQSHGSLGRLLVDHAKTVTIFGEHIPVRASTFTFGGLSGHAGQTDLLNWFGSIAPSRPRLILTHGEDRARKPLGKLVESRFGVSAEFPGLGDVVTI
jgi:metallo-beta-lactamase family protein